MNNSLPSNWFQLSDLERSILIFENKIENLENRIARGYATDGQKCIELVQKYKQQLADWKLELAGS